MYMISHVVEDMSEDDRAAFYDNFDLSGKGLFYTYKMMCQLKEEFTMDFNGSEHHR